MISTLLTCNASNCGLGGLAAGPDGSLYYAEKAIAVGDPTVGVRIKRLRPSGATSIVAGSGSCQFGVDGIVSALTGDSGQPVPNIRP